MVLFVQKTIEIPQFIDTVSMYLLCGPADPQLLLWRRQPRPHSCNSSFSCLDKVVHTPVVCNDRCLVVQRAENCDVSHLLFSRCGADRGVVHGNRAGVQLARLGAAGAFGGCRCACRALCTGTGPGLTPAIRAGKGWRGRRESDSQVTCHPIHCMTAVWHGQTRHTSTTSAPPPQPPQPPQPPPQPPKAQTGCSVCVGDFCCAFMLSTVVGVGNATGAAMRRRQRRLRAWARHERLSIAMALATVEHHSYGPTANAAPRGQTTGTKTREGEVRE